MHFQRPRLRIPALHSLRGSRSHNCSAQGTWELLRFLFPSVYPPPEARAAPAVKASARSHATQASSFRRRLRALAGDASSGDHNASVSRRLDSVPGVTVCACMLTCEVAGLF